MKRVREWMRDPRAAGLLGGVAILLVGYRLYSTVAGPPSPRERAVVSAAREAAPETEAVSPEGAGPGTAGHASSRHRKAIRWAWDRNPFLRPDALQSPAGSGDAAGTVDPKGLADLRGTVITGQSGIAIFGDRLVHSGGTIDGWTVVRVDPYAVSLRRGGETRQVEMFKPAP